MDKENLSPEVQKFIEKRAMELAITITDHAIGLSNHITAGAAVLS
jgi:hypothetical protein